MTIPNMQGQAAFKALADPTRRNILLLLSKQEMTIGDVCDQFDITRAAIKKHLVVLEQGELISVHERGRERVNRLEPHGLKVVVSWLDFFSEFWDERLANLADVIAEQKQDGIDDA